MTKFGTWQETEGWLNSIFDKKLLLLLLSDVLFILDVTREIDRDKIEIISNINKKGFNNFINWKFHINFQVVIYSRPCKGNFKF